MDSKDMSDDFEISLDRLVDGELTAEEYRRVLARMEEEPDGWRRCAMAFLEDQALRRDLEDAIPFTASSKPLQPATSATNSSSANEPVLNREAMSHGKTSPPAINGHSVRDSVRWSPPWTLLLSIAACFCLAFFGGYSWKAWVNPENRHTTNMVASSNAEEESAASNVSSEPLGNMQLFVNNGAAGQPRAIEVPYYPWQPDSELFAEESMIPPEIRAALEKAGGRVSRQHFLTPVSLDDGRQVVVPVEQLRITPVSQSRRAY